MRLHRLLMLLSLAVACTRSARGTTPPPGGASQRLAIGASGHLLVSATIDGRPYVLVLDTGANITSLSTRAVGELQIAPTGSMEINHTIIVPTGIVRSLVISGVDHDNVPIAVVDHPAAIPGEADGILGLDVLARHDIVVDFPAGEFRLYPAGTLARSPGELVSFGYSASGLIMLDLVLDLDSALPSADAARSDRTRIPAMLDLGASVSVLNRSAGALIGARGSATRMLARTGDTHLEPVRALVRDLGTFARLGMADRPAILLGTDVFEDRVLALSCRDRLAFVSR
jgi:hypothetical protein